MRDDVHELLAQGVDPGENRKAQKPTKQTRAANSFEVVAQEWYAKYGPSWFQAHGNRIIRRFERDFFPWIGGHPISDVTPFDWLSVTRRIESRGTFETASGLSNCGQVFHYGVATGRRSETPPVTSAEHFHL